MFVPRIGPRYSKEEAAEAIAASYSWAEALRHLGMCRSGNAWKILKKYAAIWGISAEHFDPHRHARGAIPQQARPIETVLVEGSTYNRGHLKKRLFDEGLKSRQCELCGQGEQWRGQRMSLILDHINGVGNDNRIQNLRIVCPNCAATLDTHCGRLSRTARLRICGGCGVEFESRFAGQQFCSRRCGSRAGGGIPRPEIRKVDRPPYARLKREVGAMGYSAVGRRYGVSDNAVRKWIRWYEAEMERAGRADGMKRFRCEQLVAGCDATFEAPDEDGILRQVVVHAREAHGMDEVPPEVADRVLAGIEGTSEEGPPAPAG
jgi:predicted small metal-binding protein